MKPPLSLKGRALRLLSGREHSRTELVSKLTRFEQEPGSLKRTLDDLQAKGLISEQRVIDSVLHRRGAQWGAARVKLELQARGLGADAVTQAVGTLRGSEVERAQTVWRQKFGQLASDAPERFKQMRFLAGRGFSADVISRVITGVDED